MTITFKPSEHDGRHHVSDEFGRVMLNTNGAPFEYPDYDTALTAAERHNVAARNVETFWAAFRAQNPDIPWRTRARNA